MLAEELRIRFPDNQLAPHSGWFENAGRPFLPFDKEADCGDAGCGHRGAGPTLRKLTAMKSLLAVNWLRALVAPASSFFPLSLRNQSCLRFTRICRNPAAGNGEHRGTN